MPVELHTLLALLMFAAFVAYALLAGADFGAGIWDLLSRGARGPAQRMAVAEAIGPVWEANHVWLIFSIVLLFTCFPAAYAAASVALFWPLHLILIGIVLRGSSYVFRAYGSTAAPAQAAWGHVFGAASAMTPILLGVCLGAISTSEGEALAPFPIVTGLLALLTCAYLAAVYLAWECQGELRDDFRRRALCVWLLAGVVSVLTLIVARAGAPRLWSGLISPPASLLLVAGALLAPASFSALWSGRYGYARLFAAAQVVMLLAGWAVAQWPYLIFPDLTIAGSAAPRATLQITLVMLPFGLAVLIPSLWCLFAVFKGRHPQAG